MLTRRGWSCRLRERLTLRAFLPFFGIDLRVGTRRGFCTIRDPITDYRAAEKRPRSECSMPDRSRPETRIPGRSAKLSSAMPW